MFIVCLFGIFATSSLLAQDRNALLLKADSLLQAGDYEKVLELADVIYQSDSSFFKGVSLHLKGVVYGIWEMDEQALESFREAQHYVPNRSVLYRSKGGFFLNRQVFDSALFNYSKALELITDDQGDDYRGELLFNKGLALSLLGEYDQAHEVLDQSIEKNDLSWKPFYQKAEVFLVQGDYEQALQYVEIARAKDFGDNPTTTFVRASALFAKGDFEKARVLAESIVDEPDEAFRANFLLADFYRDKGDYRTSLRYSLKCLELISDDFVVLNNVAFLYMQLGKFRKAIPYLDQSIELKPDFAFSYNNKANCLNELGSHQEALTLVDKSLSLDANNSWAYANRAKIYFALGLSTKACADVAKADVLKYPQVQDLQLLKAKCQ